MVPQFKGAAAMAARPRKTSKGKGPAPSVQAEAALTAYGVTLPDVTAGLGWAPTRALYVGKKMFCVFGSRGEQPGHFTMIVKLPVSAEMVQDLWYVQEAKGWFKQHNWVTAHFAPDDDVLAELDTL
jgi:hypothetical protein